MKMIGFEKPFKLEEGNLFKVYEQRKPTPENDDILVKVNSISVNPVDTKQRQMEVTQAPRVLGFDAIGTVEAIGPDVTLFSPGDVVFYAGSPDRQGSNATYQLVSEAIVAKAPHNISANEAVSLPLTGITAYETFFDTFKISHNPSENIGKSVLIVNGAGV
ncbi:Bifunctional protein: zinc-containing alcohol dehydrogenase; quinone oxidoreductase (NADPH:quinone reductase) [Staphylococcus aureus]|nr:Bifunctional protein: zinc-containing alcohol dehydrogenase; quinone oxidoreductase (NADPH:quinone reductase) [Staphylococcus aureus]CAC5934603.1 Bifunctional protein: zinc-containing alcohol dehydrogenase; quinone oxidoreductase (NADPH:quinone reductase) [Staphylococcus aureus]